MNGIVLYKKFSAQPNKRVSQNRRLRAQEKIFAKYLLDR